MSQYFLFRDQVLVDKYCNPNRLDAGHLHDVGQPGDILVSDGPVWVSAYHWYHQEGDPKAWIPIMLTDEERRLWKALILLTT